jgi:hypothetical protein
MAPSICPCNTTNASTRDQASQKEQEGPSSSCSIHPHQLIAFTIILHPGLAISFLIINFVAIIADRNQQSSEIA